MNAAYWTNIPASAASNSTTVRFRKTDPTSRSEMPSLGLEVTLDSLAKNNQATSPATPGRAKTASTVCQSMIFASGAAVATDMAMPRLSTAVVKAFIRVISLGLNHCINRGPVAVRMKANPRPAADRRSNSVMKFGVTPDSDTMATAAKPVVNAHLGPMREIKMPLGSPNAAATSSGKATSRLAVARLML